MGFGDGLPVGYAYVGDVGSFAEEFLGVVTLGLEAAEFGGAFVEEAVGLGPGAVYGALGLFGAGVVGFHRVIFKGGEEIGFYRSAAAETPHGLADFIYEISFEEAYGGQFVQEFAVELAVGGLVGGANEIARCVEALLDAVFGARGLAGFGARASAGLGVDGVGCDLSWCGHLIDNLSVGWSG